eukprot:m.133770 g.133770  ORF g.133770 m.133770 type:complete len:356 (-) comp52427_c0_seq1:154-1221(-)
MSGEVTRERFDLLVNDLDSQMLIDALLEIHSRFPHTEKMVADSMKHHKFPGAAAASAAAEEKALHSAPHRKQSMRRKSLSVDTLATASGPSSDAASSLTTNALTDASLRSPPESPAVARAKKRAFTSSQKKERPVIEGPVLLKRAASLDNLKGSNTTITSEPSSPLPSHMQVSPTPLSPSVDKKKKKGIFGGLFRSKGNEISSFPGVDESANLGMVFAVRTVKKKVNQDLAIVQGQPLQVLSMHKGPIGKWVVKNEIGEVGYVLCTDVRSNADDLRAFMSTVTPKVRNVPKELLSSPSFIVREKAENVTIVHISTSEDAHKIVLESQMSESSTTGEVRHSKDETIAAPVKKPTTV